MVYDTVSHLIMCSQCAPYYNFGWENYTLLDIAGNSDQTQILYTSVDCLHYQRSCQINPSFLVIWRVDVRSQLYPEMVVKILVLNLNFWTISLSYTPNFKYWLTMSSRSISIIQKTYTETMKNPFYLCNLNSFLPAFYFNIFLKNPIDFHTTSFAGAAFHRRCIEQLFQKPLQNLQENCNADLFVVKLQT